MAIATRNADPDAPFTLASLIGEAGSGANGEKLVETLKYHYPPELRAAMLKRHNRALTNSLGEDEIGKVARIAGAPANSDLNVKVHGGQAREADAWVTYAFHDRSGQLWKGAFLLSELGDDRPASHVSQRDALESAPAAADYAKAQAKIREAQGDPEKDALRDRVQELEAELGAAPEESAEDVAKLREELAQARARADEAEKKLKAADGGDGGTGDGKSSKPSAKKPPAK